MQKRLISMVLALSMALTAMPLPALAQSAPPDTAKAARWVVEAELLPDMGEGAFTPGKRVTKVQVIRAWNRLKKLGLAKKQLPSPDRFFPISAARPSGECRTAVLRWVGGDSPQRRRFRRKQAL